MRTLHATTVTICVSHSLDVTSQRRPSQSLRSPVALCNRRWPLVRATGKRGKCPRAPRRDFASYCRAMPCASACTSASRRADACSCGRFSPHRHRCRRPTAIGANRRRFLAVCRRFVAVLSSFVLGPSVAVLASILRMLLVLMCSAHLSIDPNCHQAHP